MSASTSRGPNLPRKQNDGPVCCPTYLMTSLSNRVDRLIKASKSKDTKRRSLISGTGGSPTTSLFSASSSSTALEQLAFTNSKLNVAQSELQACETHLAEREQELAKMRQATIVKGLKGRCSALRDCGWKWEEMAKDALRALESMSFAQTDMGESSVRASPAIYICRLNTSDLFCFSISHFLFLAT